MDFFKKIYAGSPVRLQNAIVSLYGLGWRSRRYGGIFQQEYKNFKERENYSVAQWNDYSSGELNRILLHAFDTVPYYKEKWKEIGITRRQLQNITLDTISQLPFLAKNDLRKYGRSTLLSNIRESKGTFFASSGTTGTPTSILFSHKMHQRWTAGFEARIRNWAGLTMENGRGMIGGRRIVPNAIAAPPYYRYNFFEKQVYFSAYHISGKTAENYLTGIKKYNPDYMTGYAVSNYLLASFFKEQKLDVPEMKAVITSSEKLTSKMRSVFSEVYNCKTYDSYSGLEACGLISECEFGSLHISPDVALVELLNKNNKPAQAGEVADLICTGFLNYDQPLIRYRIGDCVELQDNNCPCGRNMPVVKEILGRDEDLIIGPDGRQMVRFHNLFTGIEKIKTGQVIQHSADNYQIKILVDTPLNHKEVVSIIDKIHSQLGKGIHVDVSEVDDIPLTANGKFKAVISAIPSIST